MQLRVCSVTSLARSHAIPAAVTSPCLSASSHRSLHSAARPSLASFTIVCPPVADSITEGTLAELTVGEGGAVSVDQVIARLDTDKVTVDIRSTVGGRASKWFAKSGDTIKVGAPLLEVEVGAAGTAQAPSSAPNVKPLAPVQAPVDEPSVDESKSAPSPLAQSGAQAPAPIHPVDPRDGHVHRQPSIVFRYVRKTARNSDAGDGTHRSLILGVAVWMSTHSCSVCVLWVCSQGKRDPSGSRGPHSDSSPSAAALAMGLDFLAANEQAWAAMQALPARYRKKQLKPAQLDIIELGGAQNYEAKKKARA